MIPTDFEGSNIVFDPPEGQEKEVFSINAMVADTQNPPTPESRVTITCWKPTKEELEEITKTGRIYVWFYCGGGLIPHLVTGHHPLNSEATERNTLGDNDF